MPKIRIAVEVRNHTSEDKINGREYLGVRSENRLRESSRDLVHNLYGTKKSGKVPGTMSDPSHTTSRVSPVIFASYMGSFVLLPVSGFWLSREKCPWDNCLGGISSNRCNEGSNPT